MDAGRPPLSENLGFEPDLAWVAAGEVDPIALLARYGARCPRIHLKDLARPGESDNERNVTDVGYGTLDWTQLLPAAQQTGAEWFIVEHDLPVDPVASVRRSFDFLQRNWTHG